MVGVIPRTSLANRAIAHLSMTVLVSGLFKMRFRCAELEISAWRWKILVGRLTVIATGSRALLSGRIERLLRGLLGSTATFTVRRGVRRQRSMYRQGTGAPGNRRCVIATV